METKEFELLSVINLSHPDLINTDHDVLTKNRKTIKRQISQRKKKLGKGVWNDLSKSSFDTQNLNAIAIETLKSIIVLYTKRNYVMFLELKQKRTGDKIAKSPKKKLNKALRWLKILKGLIETDPTGNLKSLAEIEILANGLNGLKNLECQNFEESLNFFRISLRKLIEMDKESSRKFYVAEILYLSSLSSFCCAELGENFSEIFPAEIANHIQKLDRFQTSSQIARHSFESDWSHYLNANSNANPKPLKITFNGIELEFQSRIVLLALQFIEDCFRVKIGPLEEDISSNSLGIENEEVRRAKKISRETALSHFGHCLEALNDATSKTESEELLKFLDWKKTEIIVRRLVLLAMDAQRDYLSELSWDVSAHVVEAYFAKIEDVLEEKSLTMEGVEIEKLLFEKGYFQCFHIFYSAECYRKNAMFREAIFMLEECLRRIKEISEILPNFISVVATKGRLDHLRSIVMSVLAQITVQQCRNRLPEGIVRQKLDFGRPFSVRLFSVDGVGSEKSKIVYPKPIFFDVAGGFLRFPKLRI